MTQIARDCLDFDAELSALIDGELGAESLARVEAHLAGCARCRERLDELRAVDLALAALPARVASTDLAARLARRIAVEPREQGVVAPRGAARRAPPRRARRIAAWLAVPAAAAAALVLYLALRPTPAPESPTLAREPQAASAPSEPAAPAPSAPEARLAAAAPRAPEAALPAPEPAQPAPSAPSAADDLEALETEELAVVLDLETMQDLPVIANLDLLERLLHEGAG